MVANIPVSVRPSIAPFLAETFSMRYDRLSGCKRTRLVIET